MNNSKVFAIIPARNEEKNIVEVVKQTKKYVKNVIVVDDGSNDKTYDYAIKNNAVVLRHELNLGKGAALKTGCDYAIKNKADIIIVLDADTQHDPNEIPNFLKSLKNNDIVFGYRKLNKNMPIILKLGNWFINKIINILYKVNLKDSQCGYRAFNSKTYKKIRWEATDYSMESEMVAKTGMYKLKYKEIPIQTIYSDRYKGTTILDGMKIVINMILYRILNNN